MEPSPVGLSEIREFYVPLAVLDPTLEVLRTAGAEGNEAFVVWGGAVDEGCLRFTSALRPAQQAINGPDGVGVFVSGEALFELNRVLFHRGEILAGQVHSHPAEAYHSDTDDHFPLVTLLGSLSLVVPDFGTRGRKRTRDWAWYRLAGPSLWRPLDKTERVVIEQ
jgi:hypothetical protein